MLLTSSRQLIRQLWGIVVDLMFSYRLNLVVGLMFSCPRRQP